MHRTLSKTRFALRFVYVGLAIGEQCCSLVKKSLVSFHATLNSTKVSNLYYIYQVFGF